MIQETLNSIEGIGIYTIIATFLFLTVFIGVVIWLFRMDKKYVNKMENLPFEK